MHIDSRHELIRRLDVIDGFTAAASILVERAAQAPPDEARDLLGEAYDLIGLIDEMSFDHTPDKAELDAWSGSIRKSV